MYFTSSIFILIVLIILFAVFATYANSQALKKLHHKIQSLDNFTLSDYVVFNQRNAIAIDEKHQQLCIYPNRPAAIIIPMQDIVNLSLYRNKTQICQASPQHPLSEHKLNKIFQDLSEEENGHKKVRSLSLRLETKDHQNLNIFMLHSFKGFKESAAITDLYHQAIKFFSAINQHF